MSETGMLRSPTSRPWNGTPPPRGNPFLGWLSAATKGICGKRRDERSEELGARQR